MTTSDDTREQQPTDEPVANGQVPVDGEAQEAAAPDAGAEPDTAAELARITAERDEFLDQLQRSRAEFINYRKRTDQERLRLGEVFTAEALKQFLPVIDDFERALDAVPEDQKETGWVTGITMIYQKLLGILERAGVEVIDALNQPFDPSVHEAVATDPGSTGQVVTEVYRKGYKLGDTLLRAAMVKTGDAPVETVGSANTTYDA